jgi:hypothetical protein
MKKNKKTKEDVFHQHLSKHGEKIGRKHPLNSFHKNKETQKTHIFTVEIDEKVLSCYNDEATKRVFAHSKATEIVLIKALKAAI